MRTKNEVFANIRQHPEVDAFRYEYADVIEAKDPEYAEYIRARVKWASYPKLSRPSLVDKAQLEARVAQPMLQHCYEVTFERGFIEEIVIDPFVFIDRGQTLLEMAPVQRAIFSPKPLPPTLSPPLGRQVVPSPIKELMACALLAQLSAVEFVASNFQRWFPHADDVESVLASPYLSRLLILTLPKWDPQEFEPGQALDYWKRAFARREFRTMLTLEMPGYPGERSHDFQDGEYRVREVLPMPAEGRALEQEYGYLPSLHLAAKWGTAELNVLRDYELILASQRGELPLFPVGTPMTEAMYELPPRKRGRNFYD